jgi:hypothetical protein
MVFSGSASSFAASLDETGEHERRCDGVAATRFAVPGVLIALHLSRVVAAFRHTDGWTHAVGGGCFQEIVEALGLHEFEPRLGIAEKQHLSRAVGAPVDDV